MAIFVKTGELFMKKMVHALLDKFVVKNIVKKS